MGVWRCVRVCVEVCWVLNYDFKIILSTPHTLTYTHPRTTHTHAPLTPHSTYPHTLPLPQLAPTHPHNTHPHTHHLSQLTTHSPSCPIHSFLEMYLTLCHVPCRPIVNKNQNGWQTFQVPIALKYSMNVSKCTSCTKARVLSFVLFTFTTLGSIFCFMETAFSSLNLFAQEKSSDVLLAACTKQQAPSFFHLIC